MPNMGSTFQQSAWSSVDSAVRRVGLEAGSALWLLGERDAGQVQAGGGVPVQGRPAALRGLWWSDASSVPTGTAGVPCVGCPTTNRTLAQACNPSSRSDWCCQCCIDRGGGIAHCCMYGPDNCKSAGSFYHTSRNCKAPGDPEPC
jgi:hypothetical protein